jgi:hypothetical protein
LSWHLISRFSTKLARAGAHFPGLAHLRSNRRRCASVFHDLSHLSRSCPTNTISLPHPDIALLAPHTQLILTTHKLECVRLRCFRSSGSHQQHYPIPYILVLPHKHPHLPTTLDITLLLPNTCYPLASSAVDAYWPASS